MPVLGVEMNLGILTPMYCPPLFQLSGDAIALLEIEHWTKLGELTSEDDKIPLKIHTNCSC